MKRLQALFAILSIVTGISGALAFTPRNDSSCAGQLYYFDGENYQKVQPGYTCDNTQPLITCRYFDSGNHNYVACPDEPLGLYTSPRTEK